MWTSHCEQLSHHRGLRFVLERAAKPATTADVLRSWQTDAAFRSWFNGLLADAPYPAFRWETPAATSATKVQPFQFVLLDSPGLARRTEPDAFAEHYRSHPDSGVVTFQNLGGDAILVVPCPLGAASAYGHLGSFVREGPETQQQALWQAVGDALAARLGDKPVWLSTAGAGVSWLHVRLDSRPKYYGYEPYRDL
jgi:hypothetical protein